MRKFTTAQCEGFLRRVDAQLRTRCSIVVIGGGAVALKYEGKHTTTDLDLWSVRVHRGKEQAFWDAVDRVGAAESVPIQRATIAEPPYSFEDRLLPAAIDGLRKLAVLVPEAHDLALMKVARGEAHDLDAIEDIHRASPLNVATLVERYRETVPQVMGSKEMHRLNFLAAIARLFGDEKAAEVDALTAPKRTRGKSK